MRKGKFIVIDGTDGSGKATQAGLLVKRLRRGGYKVKTIDFPRYYDNFFGKFIGECLAGERGNFLKLDPYIASVLYAADRFESSTQIKEWLKEGNVVIADRYATSNQIHQGGKIKDPDNRKKFLGWLEKMEFNIFEIPRPDWIIYLEVPVNATMGLLANTASAPKKKYLNGKKDVAESSRRYLYNSRRSAIDLIRKNNNWIKINCVKFGQLLSRETIGDIIWDKVRKILK